MTFSKYIQGFLVYLGLSVDCEKLSTVYSAPLVLMVTVRVGLEEGHDIFGGSTKFSHNCRVNTKDYQQHFLGH
jgi:hypothetical protein